MINAYLRPDNRLITNIDETQLRQIKSEGLEWLDLDTPTDEERKMIEEVIDVKLLTKEQAQEIESTSKYSETEDGVIANINFIEDDKGKLKIEPLSFVLTKDGVLVSIRHSNCDIFAETGRRLNLDRNAQGSGTDVFITLIESHVDREADMVEMVTDKITQLSKDISGSANIDKEFIKRISALQEHIINLRETIFDLQRVLFSMSRSARFSSGIHERIQLILRDVDSLINHADFSFQRLDSFQDTALGLINIEQNEIVKILSVAAVVFMPPTLVASIYGMNFKYMPEIDWEWTLESGTVLPMGYLFAILLMVIFSLLTIWFFKYKKWL